MPRTLKKEVGADRRLSVLWVATLALIIICVMLYSSYKGRSIVVHYVPLVDAVIEIKLEVITAQLWLEKLISGDSHVDINIVWGHLQKAQWYAKVMLQGGESKQQKFVSLDHRVLRQKIEQTLLLIKKIRAISARRWAAKSVSGAEPVIDQQFDQVFNQLLKLAEEVETSLQQTIRNSLGQFYWTQVLLILIVLVASVLIIVIFKRYDFRRSNDIQKLQQRENELGSSEAHLRTLIEALPDLVWLKNIDGVYLSCNHKFERFFGAKEADLVGKTDYDFVAREQADCFRDNDRITMASARPNINEEEIIYADDGHVEFLETIKIPVFSVDGKLSGVLGIGRNITDRKNAEEALRRSQKMDAVGQMAGGIAHDFNNILGIIMGNLSFLKKDIGDNEKALGRVKTVQKMAQRAADLTKRLLGFSRSDQGRKALPVDINQLIKDMHSLVSRSVTLEVKLQQCLSSQLWLTEIDAADFEDALLNLILNARDSMSGGGKLTIETSNKKLDTAYAEKNQGVVAGDYVELAITDTGSGISKDIIDRIFEPFFTTKPRGKGTGLGLSMVFGFMQRSNGHIKINSEPGSGTVVRCYLPRSTGVEIEPGLVVTHDSVAPTGDETILIVDDEEELRSLAQQYLEVLGYTVVTAANACLALQLLAENPSIKLLFSDVMMPGIINGYELAEQAVKLYPDLKILLTSGYVGQTLYNVEWTRFKENLLNKPYNNFEIASRVRKVLDE